MRDLILAGIIVWLVFQALRHPWIGALGWTWISIMNPHSFSWILSTMPVAAAIGGATLIGVFVTADKRMLFTTPETRVLMLFMLWMCITLPFSYFFDESLLLWQRVMKIDLMILVAMVVLHSRRHIMLLTWVLCASIGFFGVKGGLFTLATGGSYRVWGPEGSYVEGNNEIALALVIVIPLIRFLHLQIQGKWAKRGLVAAMVLCAVAALGSQSRGALLAIGAMSTVLWWRGNNKATMGLALAVLGIALIAFMPDTWTDRMSTIKSYDLDDSANQRINAWQMAFNIAKDNVFGAGFMVSKPPLCAIYSPIPTDCRAAHSIYFMVMGEHGFIGLFLFLLLWTLVWFSAGRLRVQGRALPQTQWLSDLGSMCQVSLAGYAVGGAFLSLSYYDLPYNVLILVVLGCRWLDAKAWLSEEPQSYTITETKRSREAVA